MSASDLSSWAESRRRRIEADLRALLVIIASNDVDALQTLATRHPLAVQHINSPVDGQLALCNAVLFDRVDMVFDLYQLGANSTGPDRRGTPMEIALQRKPTLDMAMIRQLVQLNLSRTTRQVHTAVAGFILSQSADPVETLKQLHATGRFSMWSSLSGYGSSDPVSDLPLVAALHKRFMLSVAWLLQTFVKQPAAREEESCALRWAIENSDLKLLTTMLEAGFSPNRRHVGRAPILDALERGVYDERYVNVLLYHGADVALDLDARAALHVAVGRDLPLSTIKSLLAHGADVNFLPNVWSPRTPLQMACDLGNVPVAALLHFHGARPEPVNGNAPERSLLLLLGFGAEPTLAVFTPQTLRHRDRADYAQQVAREKFRIVRVEVLRLAIGLQDLELPALVTHEICVAAFGEQPMHLLWRVITAVKHFHR